MSKFGITQQFTCNYLPDQQERLLVCMSPAEELPQLYGQLMHVGFRRSGEQIYRPHCPSCNQCQSVRVDVHQFKASKSQRRILNKNSDVIVRLTELERDDHYPLYEKYISAFHADGSMYPASYTQYRNFIRSQWQEPSFLEARDENANLLAVAVTDTVNDGLSALYTYYSPEYAHLSLGKFMIMQQIEHAKKLSLPFLYLGYQIDACQKMNYKTDFKPYHRLIDNRWLIFD
jgi:arginine-tRNA-protein transferase